MRDKVLENSYNDLLRAINYKIKESTQKEITKEEKEEQRQKENQKYIDELQKTLLLFEEQIKLNGRDINKVLNNVNNVEGGSWQSLSLIDFIVTTSKVPSAYKYNLSPNEYKYNCSWYCSQEFSDNVLDAISFSTGSNKKVTDDGFLNYPVEIIKSMPSEYKKGEVCCAFGDLRSMIDIINGEKNKRFNSLNLDYDSSEYYFRHYHRTDFEQKIKDINKVKKTQNPVCGIILKKKWNINFLLNFAKKENKNGN